MNDHEIIDSALDRERITPPVFTLAILGMIIFLCLLLGLGMVESYGYFKGMNVTEALANLTADSSTSIRDFIRTNLLINHLTTFVFPALVFSYFFYKSKWTSFLNINKIPIVANLILGGVLIIAAFPLAQLAFWINMNIPMPNFLVEMEEGTSEMVRNLLLAEQPHELWFNLLTIAVIPAIGEELIFRGILQKKLDEQLKNPHLAIWLAALIFSAIHMQFQGFLSRMLLGGILGYMYHWTGNLWVPIFAHLVNNAVQIIGQYFFQKGMIETNIDQAILDVNWVMTLVAFAVVGVLSFAMKKLNDRNQEELTI
ncbi:CPBP family intramembrane metalloprotease [bacterium]|nr:CPBP family intramembrane metalloprotease [Saprospiraceae bacterium]MDC3253404.1 CPBP family intramembrane metalloprotease [bacterium]MDG1435285.1 type II CAAX endopeptidase family protein [Saprospiraceae bacterium]